MFQPARLKRAMVASCRLPLGMPSLNLLATIFLFPVIGGQQGLGEAAHGSLMAYKAIALYHYAEEQRVVVAVGGGRNDAQAVAAGFAFHPQFLASAAPKGDEAGLQRFCIARGVKEAQIGRASCRER